MLFIRGLAEREGKRRKKRQMSQEEAALRRCVSIRLWYICRAIGTEDELQNTMKKSLHWPPWTLSDRSLIVFP